jgi:tryptophan synthase beta chain
LESSHAVAHGLKMAAKLGKNRVIVINLSGRGDKDLDTAARVLGMDI